MDNKKLALELVKLAKAIVSAKTFKCPECGTKVLEQTKYCVKCKKKVEPKKGSRISAKTFKCPTCGTKVLEQTGYCVKCKKKVKPKKSSRVSAKTFKCPNCGTKVLQQTGYCVKCKKKVKPKKAKQVLAVDPMDGALDAYSDVHDEEGYGPRDLNYKGPYTNARKFAEIIMKAIPGGYNYFDPKKVSKFALSNAAYKYALGREGSVAVYIMGLRDADGALDIVQDLRRLKADEISLEKGGKTVWAHWADTEQNLMDIADNEIKGAALRVWWD
jgi:DNA-directed RNA polymerase subunit RPC12/RpoP